MNGLMQTMQPDAIATTAAVLVRHLSGRPDVGDKIERAVFGILTGQPLPESASAVSAAVNVMFTEWEDGEWLSRTVAAGKQMQPTRVDLETVR
jgi:hypothetical protein